MSLVREPPFIGVGSELFCDERRFFVCEVLFHSENGSIYLVAIGSRKKCFGQKVWCRDKLIGTIVDDGPAHVIGSEISPRAWDPFTIIKIDEAFTSYVHAIGETVERANEPLIKTLGTLWQVVHLEELGSIDGSVLTSRGRISTTTLPVRLDGWPKCAGLEIEAFEVELDPETYPTSYRPGQCAMADGFVIGYSLATFTEEDRYYVVCVPSLTESELAGPWKFKTENPSVFEEPPESSEDIEIFAVCILDLSKEALFERRELDSIHQKLREMAMERVV